MVNHVSSMCLNACKINGIVSNDLALIRHAFQNVLNLVSIDTTVYHTFILLTAFYRPPWFPLIRVTIVFAILDHLLCCPHDGGLQVEVQGCMILE